MSDIDDPPREPTDSERLRELEVAISEHRRVLEAIWPYVRMWPLCGADPKLLPVVLTIADLLGYRDEIEGDVSEILSKSGESVAAGTVGKVADWLEDRLSKCQMLNRQRADVVRELRNLEREM